MSLKLDMNSTSVSVVYRITIQVAFTTVFPEDLENDISSKMVPSTTICADPPSALPIGEIMSNNAEMGIVLQRRDVRHVLVVSFIVWFTFLAVLLLAFTSTVAIILTFISLILYAMFSYFYFRVFMIDDECTGLLINLRRIR